MNKLIVSINTSIGMSGFGVPCGSKWANDFLVLCRKPRMTVPAHSGMAIPRFIDSCVVGVKVYGSSPRRLVDEINRIRDVSINVHERPFVLCIVISCFSVIWIAHCWREVSRLLIRRLGRDSSMDGNIMIMMMMGRPISVGVEKGANRFSFIFFLKGYAVLCGGLI